MIGGEDTEVYGRFTVDKNSTYMGRFWYGDFNIVYRLVDEL